MIVEKEMRLDAISEYVKEAKKFPLLNKESERVLLQEIKKGSRRALNVMVQSNLLFVLKIAHQYKNQGLEFSDLVSAGNIGLMEAAKRADASKGTRFLTYAVWWIRQGIRKAIFQQGRIIRIATNKEEKLRTLLKNKIPVRCYIGGTDLDWGALARTSEIPFKNIEQILPLLEQPISIDKTLSAPTSKEKRAEALTVSGALVDPNSHPDKDCWENEKKQALKRAISTLKYKERAILNAYYGMEESKPMSLLEIGERLELSPERVRQIRDESLEKVHLFLVHHSQGSLSWE